MADGGGECAHRVRTNTGTVPTPLNGCRVRMAPPRSTAGKVPKDGVSNQTGTARALKDWLSTGFQQHTATDRKQVGYLSISPRCASQLGSKRKTGLALTCDHNAILCLCGRHVHRNSGKVKALARFLRRSRANKQQFTAPDPPKALPTKRGSRVPPEYTITAYGCQRWGRGVARIWRERAPCLLQHHTLFRSAPLTRNVLPSVRLETSFAA